MHALQFENPRHCHHTCSERRRGFSLRERGVVWLTGEDCGHFNILAGKLVAWFVPAVVWKLGGGRVYTSLCVLCRQSAELTDRSFVLMVEFLGEDGNAGRNER